MMTEIKENIKESDEKLDDEVLHVSCGRCYPPEAEYIISLCGILKPDSNIPKTFDASKPMCEKCEAAMPDHVAFHFPT